MAQTTTSTTSNTYTQVTTLADFFIQNVGAGTIEIVYKDVAPSASEKGILLGARDIIHSGLVTGTVYARSFSGASLISVTE